MIYSEMQIKEKIEQLLSHVAKSIKRELESEVVELKEARSNFSFKELGKYFSALSNEANLRGIQEAWLFFGISNDGQLVGSAYRADGSLQSIKREIANGTNERLTFLEVYELALDGARVLAFQIPPALRGVPTTWQGAAYAREGDALVPLPMNKLDLIRNEGGVDWSKEVVPGASLNDLDLDALQEARRLFAQKQNDPKKAAMIDALPEAAFLDKAGLTIAGQITRTTLLLLGKSEASSWFDGFIPRIT